MFYINLEQIGYICTAKFFTIKNINQQGEGREGSGAATRPYLSYLYFFHESFGRYYAGNI